MESIEIASSFVMGIFNWLFKLAGGKRVATVLSIGFLPAAIGGAISSPEPLLWLLVPVTLVIAIAAIYALKQTSFYSIPLSSCDKNTNIAAWTAMISGYVLVVMFFISMVLVMFTLSALMAAMGSSSRRR